MQKTVIAIGVISFLGQYSAICAAEDGATNMLDEVVVSASRTEQRILDTAASISVINSKQIHDGQAEQNLSETLVRVPGIFALNRQNYAQDLLISSRGFGANSAFGARGIKIYVDGIPGTVADGQGQISHIDLASADRIEVMRGPFSVLYGNSAGGVINVFSESGKPGTQISPYFESGSYGQYKFGLKISGEKDNVNYLIDGGRFHTDGYRTHSNTNRENENAKLSIALTEDTNITIVANTVDLVAQDPLGLTKAQFILDPTAAGTGAASYDSRKVMQQTQGGLVLSQRIDADNSVTLSPYYGNRHTTGYQATQFNGVVDLDRTFYGTDAKWIGQSKINNMPVKFFAGVDLNQNDDHRMTYNNNGGVLVTPQSGTNQNYSMFAKNTDEYLQMEIRPSEKFAVTSGIRNSQTQLGMYGNNAASTVNDTHTYKALTGMTSAQYYVQENSNLYVSYGSGFDTPTLNQVAYDAAYVISNSTINGNLSLQAAKTNQLELGYKSIISDSANINVAVFDTVTTNDIVVGASKSGKTSYTNAPETNRKGLEFAGHFQLPYQLSASIAYTWLNAEVVKSYTVQTAAATYTTIASGNRIPGVPNQELFADLAWRKPDNSMEFAVEGKAAGSIAVNDANSSSWAKSYAIMNLRSVTRQDVGGGWSLTEFARLDNVTNKSYIGSVIVNQKDSQYYESSPGRNYVVGIKATYKFN